MMTFNKVTHFLCIWSLLFFFILAPCQGEEIAIQPENKLELVWSQSDGLRYEIYSSYYSEGNWSIPIKITDNNANNLHPTIDVTSDGRKWLFWSAFRPDGISIEYAIFQETGWSEPLKMNVEQVSAITPSVLADKDGAIWLVWAGNDGGNDEIYYSKYAKDSVKESWLEPTILNAKNDVPDIKPVIAFNDQEEIEVRWQGFRDGQYKHLYAIHTSKGWSAEQEIVEEEAETAQAEPEINLPSFLPENSQYFLKIY